jgi:uncharacterized protein (TIGR00297 family)
MIYQLFAGFLLAVLIAFAAHKVRALNRSGALAAILLGTVIFGLGGLGWAGLLLAFFISSSALSKLAKRRKGSLDEKAAKGSERDAGQVLANGGIAGLFALLHTIFPAATWPWVGCAAALAAANADTWATELGVLNKIRPVLITSGKPVEPGTSGGISVAGTLAALAGAGLVALFGAHFWQGLVGIELNGGWAWLLGSLGAGKVDYTYTQFFFRFSVITLSGLGGSLMDSLLGATLQAIYRCPACEKETERHPLHLCGTPTVWVRGLRWLDNDWVNGACTLSGALIAILVLTG